MWGRPRRRSGVEEGEEGLASQGLGSPVASSSHQQQRVGVGALFPPSIAGSCTGLGGRFRGHSHGGSLQKQLRLKTELRQGSRGRT